MAQRTRANLQEYAECAAARRTPLHCWHCIQGFFVYHSIKNALEIGSGRLAVSPYVFSFEDLVGSVEGFTSEDFSEGISLESLPDHGQRFVTLR